MRVLAAHLAGIAVLLANSVSAFASPDKATESNTTSVKNTSLRRLIVPEELLELGAALPEVVERHDQFREVFAKLCLEKSQNELEEEQKMEEEIRGKHLDKATLAHLQKMKKGTTRMLQDSQTRKAVNCKKLKEKIGSL